MKYLGKITDDKDLVTKEYADTKQTKLTAGSNITIGLPSGYTQLEYIESSGTQYIDTGVIFTSQNIKANIKAKYVSGYQGMFGSQTAPNTSSALLIYNNVFYVGNSVDTEHNVFPINEICDVILSANNGAAIVRRNGTTYFSFSYSGSVISTYSWIIGGMSSGGSISCTFNGNIYKVVLYDNEAVIFNGIPAKNSSNVVGMYDTVTQTFFTNSGTSDFVAGPEVSNTDVISAIVPTKISELTNDAGYITDGALYATPNTPYSEVSAAYDNGLALFARDSETNMYAPFVAVLAGTFYFARTQITAISGMEMYVAVTFYCDPDGWHIEESSTSGVIPTVPTNVSAFTNDAGYITEHQDISGKEDSSNKVTTLSSSSTDTQYPSAKCVYDLVGDIESLLASI